MKKCEKNNTRSKLLKAQGVLEFSAAFVAVILLLFSIVDCAVFYQAFHSAQTFSDEAGFNLNLLGTDAVCASPDAEVLEILESRAKRYLQADLKLNIQKHSENYLYVESDKSYLGNNILAARISCNPVSGNISLRANFLYRGFFIFRGGKIITTISSVQIPKF